MLQIANGILGRDKAHGEQWYQGKSHVMRK